MPINMPTRVNRVPRLGQPAPLASSGQPATLISGEADAHKKLSDFMNAMASGNLAEAKRSAGVPRLEQPTHYSSPTTTSYGLVDTHVPPTATAGNAASGIGAPAISRPFTTNFGDPGYQNQVANEQAAQNSREQFRLNQRPVPQFRTPASASPATERPSNGYNTPNMNTYVTPGGGFAAGFGPEHGIDRMVAANNLQQQRNGYGSWERGQLRLGGAKQPDIVQSQEAPTLPTTSQFYAPRGYNEVNGGTAVQSGGGSRLIGSALMQQFTDAGNSAADLVPGSANYANSKRSLDALTSQAENARIAAQTAAGGGLSRAGQYDQRQKDIKALRYAKQKPTSLAFREAMGRINEKQNKADFTRQLQQKALTAHLATMTPQQQMQYLEAGSGATPAAPIQTQQQPAFNFGLGGSNLPGPAHGWPDMSPMLPAAPPPTTLDTPPRRSAMPDYGQPVMPGRRWGGF